MKDDPVNHPRHFTNGSIEVIEIIEDITQFFKGDDAYSVGCVIKYIARAPHKGNFVQDLQKAKWYMDNLLANYVDIDTGEAFAPEPSSQSRDQKVLRKSLVKRNAKRKNR